MNAIKTHSINFLSVIFFSCILIFSNACQIDTMDQTAVPSDNYEYFSSNTSLPIADIDKEYTPEEEEEELAKIEALLDQELIEEYRSAWAAQQEDIYNDSISTDISRSTGSTSGFVSVHFNSKNPFMDTGINIQSGKTYRISAAQLDTWKDWTTPASLEGWTTLKWMAKLYAPMAKTKSSGFYYLTGCVKNGSSKYYFQIGKGCSITPPVSGRLYIFVNDVPGFFWNNIGTAMVSVGW